MPIERIACSVFALVCLALGVFAFIVTEQRDLARQDAVTWEESAKRNRAALEDMPNFKKALKNAKGSWRRWNRIGNGSA